MQAARTPRTQSLLAFVTGAVVCTSLVLLLTGFNLWRLRSQAMQNGLGSAAQYAGAFEQHLTQTLSVVDVNLVALGEQEVPRGSALDLTHNAPYLRSVSVMDTGGRVVGSSVPGNIGVHFDSSTLLPAASGPLPLLRIGPLLGGRDLFNASPIAPGSDAPGASLLALQRDVSRPQGGFTTLVATLNPDYFANYYARNLDSSSGEVELLRLDGSLLLSTAANFAPGSKPDTAILQMLEKAEAGQLEMAGADGSPRLAAYRVSRYFPVVAVVQLNQDGLLAGWRREARITLTTVLAILAIALASSTVYFLRVRRLALEREIGIQDINNQKYALDQHAIVSITDTSGRITYANDRFCTISGYSREELIGQPHRIIKSDQHPPAFYADLWGTITQGKVWHAEVCNRAKDGELYWVSATIVPLLGIDRKVHQYVAIRTDITDRKRIEMSLEVAKNQAEQANLAKSRFLANMSHEIRTPMNAILGLLTLLQRSGLNAEQLDYTDKTYSAARTLLRLLNDILDISKVEAGKLSLDPHPFRLRRLLADLSVILSSTMADKPVQLVMDTAEDLPEVLIGDDMRLQQVLVNLGGNAIKFTHQGQVTVHVRLLHLDAIHATLEFVVEDTGIGIAAEDLERVFDSFSQAESSTTRRFGGTGLGLSICKQLVQLMGGRIEVRSTPGSGSVFSFSLRLPLGASPPASDAGPAETDAPGPASGAPDVPAPNPAMPAATRERRLQGMRLLVVEDNRINQMVAQTLLRQEGASVSLAGNGALGVQAVADHPDAFDAILMDLQMPVLDGLGATRAIRQLPGGEHMPIIAMTANVMDSDRAACLEAGMNDHVGKPFELNHLVGVLRRLVRTGDSASSCSPPAAQTNATLPLAVP